MSTAYHPAKKYKHAELLYQILPAVYRERDKKQDLKKFLNGPALLLDQIHHTLLQRYADIFPDADEAFDINSQAWLLPYIAALFDVRMVSPLEQGQREEIAHAISWRKAKGTLSVVEQVAEAVGGMEVVVHEGWKRIAATARVGMPMLPLAAYGYMGHADYEDNFKAYQATRKPDLAAMWARHPGLAAGTVDLRCLGSAVAAEENNPVAHTSGIQGKRFRWRQSSLHGAQNCNQGHSVLPLKGLTADWIPGYFDDPSARTVDFRKPNWRQGHFHPKRVMLFAATHPGFFAPVSAQRRFLWDGLLIDDEDFRRLVSVEISANKTVLRNKTLDKGPFQAIVIRQRVRLEQPAPAVWRFEGFVFSHTIEVESARLELERCGVLSVETNSNNLDETVLQADNCLFKRVQADAGLVQLQYCTVLTTTIAEKLQASDCIFNGQIRKDLAADTPPGKGCVRYSSILPGQAAGELQFSAQHELRAVFYSTEFDEPACGVLHPATPGEISSGAEDGGEMGAYHHLHLLARRKAVIKKLADFLPIGMKAVIIPDASLHHLPGEITD